MKHRLLTVTVAALLFLIQGALALAMPKSDRNIMVEDIELRPGVEVDIHVKVFVNEDAPCQSRTFFAVHGFAHTANTWKPLAEALFDNNPTGPVVCRVAAINLPGRGNSTLPTNLSYSELVLDDHVTAILATLDALRQRGVRPRALIGHSQGGLLLQMAQQRLMDAGTTLRNQFQIRDAILLASAGPAEISWEFVENGTAGTIIAQFLTNDPVLGQVIDIPDAAFPGVFFTDLANNLASGAPTPAQVTSRGYNAPEPLSATLQLVGAPPFDRPSVDARIFAPQRGTRLFMATNEQDVLFQPNENAQLYRHLTGDNNRRRLKLVNGPETVHDLHLSDPAGLLAAVADKIEF
ncbi:alpha/beta hydrolase [Candidatus Entotheonella palauensis]|uniref:alpha/beta hydrolase n=1 Tax=Candidatus Entotheonella palauensis TaxID=93172 RepID=UPI000B7FAD91|nr:alpha/beta hydrolase [Candidatus Entotheonella palauensis]